MGFAAMQLSGPHIFGPPADPDECRRVLERVVELGIDHIDTSDFYGPHLTNELIRDTLSPYPCDLVLVLVTKVGARRDDEGAGCRPSPPTRSAAPCTTTSAGSGSRPWVRSTCA